MVDNLGVERHRSRGGEPRLAIRGVDQPIEAVAEAFVAALVEPGGDTRTIDQLGGAAGALHGVEGDPAPAC